MYMYGILINPIRNINFIIVQLNTSSQKYCEELVRIWVLNFFLHVPSGQLQFLLSLIDFFLAQLT